MNLEFSFEEPSVVFSLKELTAEKKIIHERAIFRAQKYLSAEAELLESIIEADKNKIFEDFGLAYLTPYCVKHLGLSEDVAAIFVRVARKTYEVPELKAAIEEGKLSVTKAKTIASVITPGNQEVWIKNAEALSKSQLERAVAYESPKSVKRSGFTFITLFQNQKVAKIELRILLRFARATIESGMLWNERGAGRLQNCIWWERRGVFIYITEAVNALTQ